MKMRNLAQMWDSESKEMHEKYILKHVHVAQFIKSVLHALNLALKTGAWTFCIQLIVMDTNCP